MIPPRLTRRQKQEYDSQQARERGARRIKGQSFLIGKSPYGLAFVCRGCRKPIFWGSRCNACATGRPRTIFRPDEKTIAEELVA